MKLKWIKKKKYIGILFTLFLGTILFWNVCDKYLKQEEPYHHQNPYFYKADETVVEYEGYFYLHTYRPFYQNVDLNITELGVFENGALYTLELGQLEVKDPLDELGWGRRYIGYFYVTEDGIYMTASGGDGFTKELNQEMMQLLQEDEDEFLERCVIACCEEGTEDRVDDQGYHIWVEVDGDRRIFRIRNNYYYGSKDYLLMMWEKGKGITYYVHGNGMMNMHVEFGVDLPEKQKVDYGFPYKLFHYEEITGEKEEGE